MEKLKLTKEMFSATGTRVNLIAQPTDIICTEDKAREIIEKIFLHDYPFSEEWYDTLLKILQEMRFIANVKRIVLSIQNVNIDTGLIYISLNPELKKDMYEIKELSEETRKLIFRELIKKLKEEHNAGTESYST